MISLLVGSTNIGMRGGDDNDVMTVPDDVWDAEKNYTITHPNLRQSGNPPSQACISVKVIYNSGWVNSAGGGNSATARQRAIDVIAEAQKIYNTKYTQANRLGTGVTFNIIGGKKLYLLITLLLLVYLCPFLLRLYQLFSFVKNSSYI